MKLNGYIIYDDAHRVIIATGFARASSNVKTGAMIQIWILVKNLDPVAAVESGRDVLVCGGCIHRGKLARKTRSKREKRTCYVNLGQAPLAVWRAWQRGSYPTLPSVEAFRGRAVRFGAYGDPTHIPFSLAKSIADVADVRTGYTHQWSKSINQPWQSLVMASVDNEAERQLAASLGWGTFLVTPKGQPAPATAIHCRSESHGVQCVDCGLCKGRTGSNGAQIWIEAHGTSAAFFGSN